MAEYTDAELSLAVQKGDITQEEYDKLKGNQNVRNAVTGEFAKETERNDPERVLETDGRKAPPSAKTLARININRCINDLGQSDTEAAADQAASNLILAVMEYRGIKLREITENHISHGSNPA